MAAAVLVTGGAGFIGSHLVDRLLAEGRRVVVVDDLSTGHLVNLEQAQESDRFVFAEVDVTTNALDVIVALHAPEVIVHLAAQMSVAVSVAEPARDAMINVVGTVCVLEAARRHGVGKVVFASSGGAIYGEAPLADMPLPESHPGPGHSPYGASKRAGEEYLRTFASLYELRWSAIAPANVYGPRQDPAGEGGVVALFTQRMLDDEPCVINGDGEQTRDFVYVDDVVDAFVRAIEDGDGERFNAGTGISTTVNGLFGALKAATGYQRDAHYGPARSGDIQHNAVDPANAADRLGWRPKTHLDEGLARTVAWARGGPTTNLT